jgi:branched-chain amino acid transport system permease protein
MGWIEFAENILSGITFGTVYGLLGMSIVLLYRTNHLFNMAQTEIATFTVITMFFLLKKMSYGPAFAATLVISFFLGMFLHIGVMRIITERKNVQKTSATVITIGLFSIFNAMSFYFFGEEPEPFPALWPSKSISMFEISIQYGEIVMVICAILTIIAIMAFFRFTKLGLALEAIAENESAARLRGVRTSNYLAVSWGITFVLSAICAIFLAPTLFLTPIMLTHVFAYSLMAVGIGGLESPFGAMVGGILIGVVENLSSNWAVVGSDLKFVAVNLTLVMILIVRPRGIWGRREQRRA